MKKEDKLDFMCPEHQEKIISVQQSEKGENKIYCLKCLTEKQTPIEQLSLELNGLRSKKIKSLIVEGNKGNKKLVKLQKLFFKVKDQFNKQLHEIIEMISQGIINIKTGINQEIQLLNQPIQQLTFTQFNQQIKILKEQNQDEKYLIKIGELRFQVIEKFYHNLKQLVTQIKNESICKKQDDEVPNTLINQQQKLNQYQLTKSIRGGNSCYAIDMNKDEDILINGNGNDIQMWNIKSDGSVIFKQKLEGHSYAILSLCFSKKENWFVSGDMDKKIRIWKEIQEDNWICKQVLQAHQHCVNEIILDNNEEELISCSDDQTIKIWKKNTQANQWQCTQTLNHTNSVYFLSLNPDGYILASRGYDKLRIWKKGAQQEWQQTQVIDHPKNDYYLRVKFTDNKELIVSTKKQGKLIIFIENDLGQFQIFFEIKLNQFEEQDIFCFPIIYCNQLELIFLRLSKNHTFILKKVKTGEFITHQVLNGDYSAGFVFKDGKFCILHEQSIIQHQIWKYE